MMFRKCITLLLLTLLVNVNAWALSHCKKNEVDYFSCQIKDSSKVVSFCGSSPVETDLNVGWVQYRFGRVGKPELIYPKKKEQSKSQFEYNYFRPSDSEGSWIDVRFLVSGTYHSFDMLYRNSSGEYEGGFAQQKNHGKFLEQDCQVVDDKYWERLINAPIEHAGKGEISERLNAFQQKQREK